MQKIAYSAKDTPARALRTCIYNILCKNAQFNCQSIYEMHAMQLYCHAWQLLLTHTVHIQLYTYWTCRAIGGYVTVVATYFPKLGGYITCRILLVRSTNGNGNRILSNRILFYRTTLHFVSIKPDLPASVNCQQH